MRNWKITRTKTRWETYKSPSCWPNDLIGWLLRSLGEPQWGKTWDYIGGTIYFWKETLLTAFLLRWD